MRDSSPANATQLKFNFPKGSGPFLRRGPFFGLPPPGPPPCEGNGSDASGQGRTEAASNLGVADWAFIAGAFIIPTRTGPARAATPAAARATFLAPFSSIATRPVRIA